MRIKICTFANTCPKFRSLLRREKQPKVRCNFKDPTPLNVDCKYEPAHALTIFATGVVATTGFAASASYFVERYFSLGKPSIENKLDTLLQQLVSRGVVVPDPSVPPPLPVATADVPSVPPPPPPVAPPAEVASVPPPPVGSAASASKD